MIVIHLLYITCVFVWHVSIEVERMRIAQTYEPQSLNGANLNIDSFAFR